MIIIECMQAPCVLIHPSCFFDSEWNNLPNVYRNSLISSSKKHQPVPCHTPQPKCFSFLLFHFMLKCHRSKNAKSMDFWMTGSFPQKASTFPPWSLVSPRKQHWLTGVQGKSSAACAVERSNSLPVLSLIIPSIASSLAETFEMVVV